MRRLVPIIIVAAVFTGCVSYKPDPSLVGHYEAPTGEAIDIQLDGNIVYFFHDKVDFIGVVKIARRDPMVIQVVEPDRTPWVGTKISFSADHHEIQVQWPTSAGESNSAQRPTHYYVK